MHITIFRRHRIRVSDDVAYCYRFCRSVVGLSVGLSKTAQRINMIFSGWAATVTASVVSKFGDNRPKGRGARRGYYGEN